MTSAGRPLPSSVALLIALTAATRLPVAPPLAPSVTPSLQLPVTALVCCCHRRCRQSILLTQSIAPSFLSFAPSIVIDVSVSGKSSARSFPSPLPPLVLIWCPPQPPKTRRSSANVQSRSPPLIAQSSPSAAAALSKGHHHASVLLKRSVSVAPNGPRRSTATPRQPRVVHGWVNTWVAFGLVGLGPDF